MRITVVLPTHNRVTLLQDAIESVLKQSWRDWELVVVDDGTSPPVPQRLAQEIKQAIRWIRVEPAGGLSNARNQGIAGADGDIVTFLDDDDLLAPNALDLVAQQFLENPDLDCLFINVEPFGAAGEGMRNNQAPALSALLRRMGLEGKTEGVLPLDHGLFPAMLDGLPLAFQRVAIRRSVLERVGLYQLGAFGDLEWNFRLALRCRCALLMMPVYLVRCDGQSFFTRGDAQERLLDAAIRIRCQLAELPDVVSKADLASCVRRALAKARFDKAYFSYVSGKKFQWREFMGSIDGRFGWRHASLFSKVVLSKLQIGATAKSR